MHSPFNWPIALAAWPASRLSGVGDDYCRGNAPSARRARAGEAGKEIQVTHTRYIKREQRNQITHD